MEIAKNNDRGHCLFLKSTCDIGAPPSRAPKQAEEQPRETWPLCLYSSSVLHIGDQAYGLSVRNKQFGCWHPGGGGGGGVKEADNWSR